MTITKYVLYDENNDPANGDIYDTYAEAMAASEAEDEPTAVVEYEFEFSDSSLVDERYNSWPAS